MDVGSLSYSLHLRTGLVKRSPYGVLPQIAAPKYVMKVGIQEIRI
jgi:hypothetical protein